MYFKSYTTIHQLMITSCVPFSRACSVCFTPVTETAILGLSTDGSGPPSPRDLLGFLIFDFEPGTSVVPSVDPGGPRRLPAEDAMLKIYWGLNLGAGTVGSLGRPCRLSQVSLSPCLLSCLSTNYQSLEASRIRYEN